MEKNAKKKKELKRNNNNNNNNNMCKYNCGNLSKGKFNTCGWNCPNKPKIKTKIKFKYNDDSWQHNLLHQPEFKMKQQ
jgi:hypothetical protein